MGGDTETETETEAETEPETEPEIETEAKYLTPSPREAGGG